MSIRWSEVDSFAGNFCSAAATERRPCPICGSERSRNVLQFDQFQFYCDSAEVAKRVDVREVQCLDCFALYLNPCYSEEGFRALFAEAGCSYGSAVSHTLQQIDWLKTRGLLHTGKRLLDAGCYDGAFLAKLPDDVERIGVDIDGPAIERGRATLSSKGVEFIHGDFESFRCDKPLDVITMFHVLEHLPRPLAVLRHLRSMAHAGTRLIIEVPILENGFTNDINGFFTVQHMTHFTRESLMNCLARAGWKAIESQEHSEYNGFRVMASPGEFIPTMAQESEVVSLLRQYLAHWNLAVKAVEDQLASLMPAKKCVIWGAGAHTEFLYQNDFPVSQTQRPAVCDCRRRSDQEGEELAGNRNSCSRCIKRACFFRGISPGFELQQSRRNCQSGGRTWNSSGSRRYPV